jgi:hypothetical protein
MRYEPFRRPTRADGSPSPQFEATLQGWLAYVRGAVAVAKARLGSDAFDVEVSFGSTTGWLDVNRYYDPPIDDGPGTVDDTARAIVARTVEAVRDPALGVPGVRVGDGFSVSSWSGPPSKAPPGVAAVHRFVSAKGAVFPRDRKASTSVSRDALGAVDGSFGQGGTFREAFVPNVAIGFPEIALTAVEDRSLAFDLTDLANTDRNGVPRGLETAPEIWITSISLDPVSTNVSGTPLTRDEAFAIKEKSALRSLAAYVGRGASRVFFYQPPELTLVDDADETGGPVVRSLGRFLAAFDGPGPAGAPRPLVLRSIASCPDSVEFEGDGTAAHPPLRHAELVAFFPFQVAPKRFVAAAYVMTRSLGRPRGLAGPARFDLPEAEYRLVVAGAAPGTTAKLLDPRTGEERAVPAQNIDDALELTVPLGDAPRLLVLDEP